VAYGVTSMAATDSSVGVDHPTVVPTNFEDRSPDRRGDSERADGE